MKYNEFKPNWRMKSEENDIYRSMSKWGDSSYYSEPSEALYIMIKERLNLTDDDFIQMSGRITSIDDIVNQPMNISSANIAEMEAIVGKANVLQDMVSRIAAAYGKSTYDCMRLRDAEIENLPDIVVAPTTEEQIIALVKFCYSKGIPMYSSGGRTNTTRSTEAFKGGIIIDFKRNYNKIINFNEIDQTITIMSGITGPQLEEVLNNARKYFNNVIGNYTCGHMPQSFEFSTVGGWIMSRSSGNNYSGYGAIDDIILSAKYVTSKGVVNTVKGNRSAPMPCFDEIMLGSEGEYGVLISATLKVRRFYEDTRRPFSYIFSNLDNAVKCVRDIMQSESALPCSLRICDNDATDVIMKMNAVVDKGVISPFIRKLGGNDNRCLVIGTCEGSKNYVSLARRNVSRTQARYGGVSATSYLSKKWEQNLFSDAYTRDILLDYGIVRDYLGCNVGWTNLFDKYSAIKALVETRPNTFSMIHFKNVTAQGTLLCCEYIGKFDNVDDYREYNQMLVQRIGEIAGSVCMNHSVGYEFIDSIAKVLDPMQFGMLKALKKYFDPKNLFCPRNDGRNKS